MISVNICIGKPEDLNPVKSRQIDKTEMNDEEKNSEENIWRII